MSAPDHSNALSPLLDGVREGDGHAIHDARVATRRLREALPLVGSLSNAHTEELRRAFRKVGRALGRARDGDVALGLLGEMVRRRPDARSAAATMGQMLERERLADRRRLIKAMEATDFCRAVAEIEPWIAVKGWRPFRRRRAFRKGWQALLQMRVSRRAARLRKRIDEAGGVYFPNRVHAVRIAAKKLRYALEIADAAGVWRCDGAMDVLKDTQDTLGHVHDCQLLAERLTERDPSGPAADETRHLLIEALEADVHEFHRRYLSQRERLRYLADLAERRISDGRDVGHLAPGLLAAGAVLLPVTWWVLSGGDRQTRPKPVPAKRKAAAVA